MDYLINDEIFGNDNDELLQSPQFDSGLWSDDLITDLHNDNQFFNDQDFDINQLSLSLDDNANNASIMTQARSNIFQASPESFHHVLSPDLCHINDSTSRHLRTVTLVHKRKSPLDSRDTLDMCVNEPKKFIYDHGYDNIATHDGDLLDMRHKTAFYVPKLNNQRDDKRSFVKFKKPDKITLFQIAPAVSNWGEKGSIDRAKYSLSPSTSSPDSAIDCSITSNGANRSSTNDDVPFYNYATTTTNNNNNSNAHNRFYEMKYKYHKDDSYATKLSNCTRLFQSPIPQTGVLILTEEEKRTLLIEGYQIPGRLPLTKQDERNLKKVRRKIKNKISAQESRRKKKEYMEALEKKVEIYAHENIELRKKLESQENTNKSLVGQLRHLQQMLGRASSNTTSTCVMVFLLCFSLILVGLPEINQPMKLPQSVLIVGNIHKVGYGSLLHRERSHMTAMQRYFPPDIDGFVNMSYDIGETNREIMMEPRKFSDQSKGVEPLDSLESPVTGQRKSILLGSIKEEDDECVQYGPRFLWWLIQSPTFNTDEPNMPIGTMTIDKSEYTHFRDDIVAATLSPSHPALKNESALYNHSIWRFNSSNERLSIAITGSAT